MGHCPAAVELLEPRQLLTNTAPCSLSGYVYIDVNDNGLAAPGNPAIPDEYTSNNGVVSSNGHGLSNVPVTLTIKGSTGHITTSTDANGFFTFTGLPAGTYAVAEGTVAKGSTVVTPDSDGSDLEGIVTVGTQGGTAGDDVISGAVLISTVTAGTNGVGNLFGELYPSSISGVVYFDKNSNDTKDIGDTALGGVTLTLTGIDDRGNAVSTTTTSSAVDGTYSFKGLRPSNAAGYTVTETHPDGYTDETSNPGTTGGTAAIGTISSIVLAQGTDSTTNNFGELLGGVTHNVLSNLSGTVYVDNNANGTLDSGDTGLKGVVVTLTSTAGATQTATTDENGYYSFNGLSSGTYTVTESHPAGYKDETSNPGSTNGTAGIGTISSITLGAGVSSTDNNFGELTGSLSGKVYVDQNANDTFDGIDTGLAGVTVALTGSNGTTLTATTDSNGNYSFIGLLAGTYTLTETQPTSYLGETSNVGSQTSGTASIGAISTIALGAGVNGTNNNFGELTGSLSGKVYVDQSANDTFDGIDTGLAGVTVTLTGSNGTTLTATTDSNGNYSFGGLLAGTYTLTETQPTSYLGETSNVGSQASGTASIGAISTIALGAGVNGTNNNFGELTGSLSGKVYVDQNANDTFDGTDTGLAGVTVTLTGSNGTTLTATTDSNGNYRFSGLLAGTYTLTETQPTGYLGETSNIGTQASGTASIGAISTIALGAGVNGTNNNFGELLYTPTVSTTPNLTSVSAGLTGVLTDTAVVSGGYNPHGSITFTLRNGTTVLDTEVVPVVGNGTYSPLNGYTLPANATPGTYQWTAVYSGDSNNQGYTDAGGEAFSSVNIGGSHQGAYNITLDGNNESVDAGNFSDSYVGGNHQSFMFCIDIGHYINYSTTYPAEINSIGDVKDYGGAGLPAVNTREMAYLISHETQSANLDTMALQAAIWKVEYGTRFNLNADGSLLADYNQYVQDAISHQNDPISGGVLFINPYSGGQSNPNYSIQAQIAYDPTIDAGEQVKVTANPTISTTPNLTSLPAGSTGVLKDTAVLSGGNNPQGSITFTLSNGTTVLYSEAVPVVGNGTYSTPKGYTLPADATPGTYQWTAVYSGDSNNQGYTDAGGETFSTVNVGPNYQGTFYVTFDGSARSESAGNFRSASLAGKPESFMYCIDINHVINPGQGYGAEINSIGDVKDFGGSGLPAVNAREIAYLVSHEGVTGGVDTMALQAAIWKVEYGYRFEFGGTSTPDSDQIVSHYNAYVQDAIAHMNEPISGGVLFINSFNGSAQSPDYSVQAQITFDPSFDAGEQVKVTAIKTTTVNLSASTVYEGDTANYTFTATLSSPSSGDTVITTDKGTITIGNGQTTGTLVIASGNTEDVYLDATSKTATITSATGGNFENLVVATATATAYVNDTTNDTSVSLSGSTVSEGDTANYTFTATLSNPSHGDTVIVTDKGTITIGNGQTTGTLVIASGNTEDVYLDATSKTATITSATGGNFENLVVATATATAYVNDTINSTTVTLGSVTTNASPTIVYTASVNNAVTVTPLVITLNNGATITIPVGSTTGTSAPQAIPTNVTSFTASITGVSGGNYEKLDITSTKTTIESIISGTKYFDITGNGYSSDDTPLQGASFSLYLDSTTSGVSGSLDVADGKALATVTSAANGTYLFPNLLPGTYFVQENQMAGYVQTGPTLASYYTIVVKAGTQNGGYNFDDAEVCDKTEINKISYVISGPGITGTKTVTDLRGNTFQGDTVTVTYTTVVAGETLSLVSYIAPGATFNASTASQQTIFQAASYKSLTSDIGHIHTLTVQLPNCDYQVDFVCGPPIDHFGPAGSNIFYSAQNRLFSADNQGTQLYAASSLSGTVSNEQGVLVNYLVTLTGTDIYGNVVNLTTKTDSKGCYTFTSLKASNAVGYSIAVTPPTGYINGVDAVGNLGGNAGSGVVSGVFVNTNKTGTGYNFLFKKKI